MKAKKYDVIAAIEVGSGLISMSIAEVDNKGDIKVLDDMWKPTNMGKDTFVYGRVQLETIREACEVLAEYAGTIDEYKIKKYRAVCTSGIREAVNQGYVIDQIRIKTGIYADVINNSQQRFYIYKTIKQHIFESNVKTNTGTLILDVRSGGVEISLYAHGTLIFTEYIRIGALRLREQFTDIEGKVLNYPSLMGEFAYSRMDFLKHTFAQYDINKIIGLSDGLWAALEIVKPDSGNLNQEKLSRELLSKIIRTVKNYSSDKIMNDYKLTQNETDILLPSVILFDTILKMIKINEIHMIRTSLRKGIILDMTDNLFNMPGKQEAINDIVSSVWHIGKKFLIDVNHSKYIENLSLKIFEKSEKFHGLNEQYRMYLRFAAILHDVGKFINLSKYNVHTHDIILSQNIMGYSDRELKIIANIARYHGDEIPETSHETFGTLSTDDQLSVSKLAGILKLAVSLDTSHKRKIKEVDIKAQGQNFRFIISADENVELEEWSFIKNSAFFEEVMGVKPIFEHKG